MWLLLKINMVCKLVKLACKFFDPDHVELEGIVTLLFCWFHLLLKIKVDRLGKLARDQIWKLGSKRYWKYKIGWQCPIKGLKKFGHQSFL